MQIKKHLPLLLLGVFALPVFAQTAQQDVQRDINQQQRIESGLKSGALSTGEAARLEKEQSRVDRVESNALRDGKLSDAERARIDRMQDRASSDIRAAKSNGVTGNPQSASSQRMQADVARNINQEQRIKNGLQDGSLTRKEASRLEKGEARISHREAAAGRDGHVGAREQAHIQTTENRVSGRIHQQRHDGQHRN